MLPQPQASPLIAGSVLPIKRAEELLQTLPGVIAVRIIASETGAVDEIHVLTTSDVAPKQTVRNIESALIAHLGMRVDHRKISVATSLEPKKARVVAEDVEVATPAPVVEADGGGRRLFCFEDVEVRRSRSKGLACRVTLVKGDKSYVGEAEGMENERSRMELAARATLRAIGSAEAGSKPMDLSGARVVEAFDREFVFVGVWVPQGRESVLLAGSCEVRDSAETASVLAVLDATNRWLFLPVAGSR
ncbi:MAG: hypothetical protein MNPFHGCM_00816 [Gemmatimonadaceae bacterium]|nr:hypothetical protein [Gemmatimonadaceae bacterium]